MDVNKKVKTLSIVSFFIISILGTLFHFAYEFLGENLVLGAIFAVNESVWEHLKILVIPMFICTIYEYIILKEKSDNIFFALVLKVIISMLFVIGVFYTYTSILGNNIPLVDITTFFIAVLIGQIIWYNAINHNISKKLNNISLIILIIILLSFIIFTYSPLKFDIFRDNTDKTYGIFDEV